MSEQEPTRNPLADVEAMIRILSEEKRTLRPGDDAQICGQLLEAILDSLIAQSAALESKDATIAELVEALEAARELYELREDEMESHRFAPHPTDLLVSAALTRAKGQP
jgi:hypothetical protein